MWDFIIEVRVRKPIGDVYPGERVTHAAMGILYGAMLAYLIPTIRLWWDMPSELSVSPAPVPSALRRALTVMAVSGIRDLYAACGLPGAAWPWKIAEPTQRSANVPH